MTFSVVVPRSEDGVFSEEAAASLVGQDVLLRTGDRIGIIVDAFLTTTLDLVITVEVVAS